MSNVRVVSFLGQDYSFRVKEDEEQLFQQAAELLQRKLNEARERHTGDSHQLLVTTALALCVPHIQQAEQLQRTEQRLAALVERLEQHAATAPLSNPDGA